MASPELELQGAIVARLKSDATVTALIGQRVYDPVPASPVFPYVSFGPRDAISDDADCITAFEISLQLDVWSREPGSKQALQIADAIRTSLDEYAFTLTANAAVLFEHRLTRTFRDPDGLSTQAAITFTGVVEKH